MTNLDLSGLQAAVSSRSKAKVWETLTRDQLKTGVQVLTFDPALAKTGWSLIEAFWSVHGTKLNVRQTGMIKGYDGPETSFEQTYLRTEHIEDEALLVMQRWAFPGVHVCVEMPAVMGQRVESSLMAGYAVRRALQTFKGRTPYMVSNVHAKALLLRREQRGAGAKANLKQAVERFITNSTKPSPWNQDVTDSVALGIAHLADLKAEKEKKA
jgi:Holliday junction resolvasome RuvABC endonuclease subunit